MARRVASAIAELNDLIGDDAQVDFTVVFRLDESDVNGAIV